LAKFVRIVQWVAALATTALFIAYLASLFWGKAARGAHMKFIFLNLGIQMAVDERDSRLIFDALVDAEHHERA